jgi:hypothetical protein
MRRQWRRSVVERRLVSVRASARPAGRVFAIGASIGVTGDGDTSSGVHAELEMLRNGGWFASIEGTLVYEATASHYIFEEPAGNLEVGRTGVDALLRFGMHSGRRVYVRPSGAVGLGVSRHEMFETQDSDLFDPMVSAYADWSAGLRLGVALAAGVQLGRIGIELNVARVGRLQNANPGRSAEDRSLSAGVALRFYR